VSAARGCGGSGGSGLWGRWRAIPRTLPGIAIIDIENAGQRSRVDACIDPHAPTVSETELDKPASTSRSAAGREARHRRRSRRWHWKRFSVSTALVESERAINGQTAEQGSPTEFPIDNAFYSVKGC
jgi:hypothetical protein